jgi:hypothetical protein
MNAAFIPLIATRVPADVFRTAQFAGYRRRAAADASELQALSGATQGKA